MFSKSGLCVLALAGAVSSSASAAIISFTQHSLWTAFSVANGQTIFVEDFNDIADGFYTSPFSSTTGPVQWDASAANGIYVQGGVFSTNAPEQLSFSFSSAPVQGVGGNFFATDVNFNVVPSIVYVSLADGTTYAGYIDSASSFTGFYSTGAAITGISLRGIGFPSGAAVYPSVDNMSFAAVPAPGVLALLATAGLVSRRRR